MSRVVSRCACLGPVVCAAALLQLTAADKRRTGVVALYQALNQTCAPVARRRNLKQYWRNPSYNGVRYMFCTILGLLLGSIFWDLGSNT